MITRLEFWPHLRKTEYYFSRTYSFRFRSSRLKHLTLTPRSHKFCALPCPIPVSEKRLKRHLCFLTGKIDNKVKLDLIKDELRRVAEERQEMQEVEKRKIAEAKEELVDPAPVLDANATTSCTNKDMEVLEDALDQLSKEKKTLIVEKEEIEDLKEEMADYKEDVNELKEVTLQAADANKATNIKETKGAKRLFNQVSNMINKMDKALLQLEKKESELKANLKLTDGSVVEEPAHDELIKIDELMGAIKKLSKVPDAARLAHIERVLGKIDDDRDGSIKVEDVLKVRI